MSVDEIDNSADEDDLFEHYRIVADKGQGLIRDLKTSGASSVTRKS